MKKQLNPNIKPLKFVKFHMKQKKQGKYNNIWANKSKSLSFWDNLNCSKFKTQESLVHDIEYLGTLSIKPILFWHNHSLRYS